MPVAHLTDRSILRVAGADARGFLQNIITTDLDRLAPASMLPGALLTPQGKILFDFLIGTSGDGFILDCRRAAAEDFMKRLSLYRLRAKVTIELADQGLVAVGWEPDSDSLGTDSSAFRDLRFVDASVFRHYGPNLPCADAGEGDWTAFRIARGVPESGADFGSAEAFPHDALLDQMEGVGLRKGCYVGQEVVSRMQHRGTARRRFLVATATATLPAPGTAVTVGGRPVGTLGSVAGNRALALVRIDRIREAMDAGTPVVAGDVAVDLAIPDWARFTFPETGAGEAES